MLRRRSLVKIGGRGDGEARRTGSGDLRRLTWSSRRCEVLSCCRGWSLLRGEVRLRHAVRRSRGRTRLRLEFGLGGRARHLRRSLRLLALLLGRRRVMHRSCDVVDRGRRVGHAGDAGGRASEGGAAVRLLRRRGLGRDVDERNRVGDRVAGAKLLDEDSDVDLRVTLLESRSCAFRGLREGQ